jgi:hypothetical protein
MKVITQRVCNFFKKVQDFMDMKIIQKNNILQNRLNIYK